jgi:type IX secretion system PorP/SprF family membrane protein
MKRFFLILFFLLAFIKSWAQYPAVYSQYIFNGLAINPAYAGSSGSLNITALHRSQWIGFEGAPRTNTIAVHSPMKNEKVCLGLLIFKDRYGVSDQTGVLASYAYRISIGKGKLSMGLQGGFQAAKYDWNNLRTSQGDDQVFTGIEKVARPSAGTGIYYYSEKIFAGLSLPEMLTVSVNPAYKNEVRYKTYFLTAGYTFSLGNEFQLRPSFLVKCAGNSSLQYDLNSFLYYRGKFGVGISYRDSDALVFLAKIQANKQLSIGYSYDKTISRLSSYSTGSHEIMVSYDFKYTVKTNSPRSF